MPLEIPKDPKTYTTVYENFKGVDFTNDPSNVWQKRSPEAVNMMPDESGRPFKRTGWEIVLSSDDLAQKYYDDGATGVGEGKPSETTIRKCYYFEMAGFDHIVIFTNYGVFFYRNGDLLSSVDIASGSNPSSNLSYDKSVIDSYYRAFFFEGGGTRAFYIYGNFKIWKYYWDDSGSKFKFEQAETYIPRVNISIDPKHEDGQAFEDVNLFSDFVAEEYQNNLYKTIDRSAGHAPRTSITGATVYVDDYAFTTYAENDGTYVFTYDSANASWLLSGDQVYISNYGITLNTTAAIPNNATITVEMLRVFRIDLGRTITSITGMKVYVSHSTQFDTELTIEASSSPPSSASKCTITTGAGGSYLQFYQSELPLVAGEDAIRVIFPRNLAATTLRTVLTTATATAS